MHLNPFTPTEPVSDPSRLVGREQQLNTAIAAVRNGRSLIVSGDRGVGKSSLTTVLTSILTGRASYSDTIAQCLTAVFACSPGSTLDEAVDGLLLSLSRSSGTPIGASRTLAAGAGFNLSGISAEIRTETQAKVVTENASRIVDAISEIRARGIGPETPIVLVLDEADQLKLPSMPGVLVKTTKEMVAAEGLGIVSFVLVGQRNIVQRLRQEHPSVPRAFEVLWLAPLPEKICERIIEVGEAFSGIRFDPAIRSVIAKASIGFPAVVQRLADSCCVVDKDAFIDAIDFEDGLAVAIERIKIEETLQSISALSGNLGKKAISYLAQRQMPVPLEEITTSLAANSTAIIASLDLLEQSGVLERDGDHFQLADRLVAAYLTLEETRNRALHDVREIATILNARGWSTRALEPDEHRGIDLIATKGRWMFRRRIGTLYIGEAERLGAQGIESLRLQFETARQLFNLDEVWVIGRGNLDVRVGDAIRQIDRVMYIPWHLLDKTTTAF